jgi:hypothetical protein
MEARTHNSNRKHAAIKKRFKQLSSKTAAAGKKIFTCAAIIEQIAREYYLANNTVEKIIVRK